MTKPIRLTLGLLLAAALALAGLAVWQHRRAEQAERQLGLDASRVLSSVFTQARELRVARLTGTAIAKSASDGLLFHSEQETRAPFAVGYFVDLRRIGPSDYAWDVERKVMSIRIPDVTVESPSVDMAQAEVRQQGLWISRKTGADLQRQGSQRLALTADTKARSDENMARARTAAVAAVTALVRQPLAAAGIDGVTVAVHFPWEGVQSDRQWDRSRRLEEVLGNGG